MSAFVLVPGFGGAADFDFVAPMLARANEVSIVEATAPIHAGPETVLVGYSLGAVVAAAHAAEHPVAALVLICGWAQPTARLVDWAEHAGDAAFARHTMVGPDSDRAPILDVELLPLAQTLQLARLGEIGSPTLVIGATFDLVATAHQSRLLHGGIADSRYVELATGHAALVERPAEVLSLVSEFAAHPSVVRAVTG
ncbi:alpha/beta fold hydrolase [Lysinimonas soli]|uniref:Alpha/beta fold hydrolase n=1 Tax=Lysinimonas soli TaxID=1074233 RepID=A0ABW0NMN9_9MICO